MHSLIKKLSYGEVSQQRDDERKCEVESCKRMASCRIRDYRFTGIEEGATVSNLCHEPLDEWHYLCDWHRRKPRCVNLEEQEASVQEWRNAPVNE